MARPGLPALLACAWRPWIGFPERARQDPTLGEALGEILRWRGPVALLEAALAWGALRRFWLDLLDPAGTFWGQVLALKPELSPAELAEVLRLGPRPPAYGAGLPWALALGFLGLGGLWLHHLAWDHGCLALLRGLKARRGWRATGVAVAEALKVGTLGPLAGLLAFLPGPGLLLALPGALLGLWFWGARGLALAAFHGCEPWRGLGAVILHALLLPVVYLALFLLCVAVAWGLT